MYKEHRSGLGWSPGMIDVIGILSLRRSFFVSCITIWIFFFFYRFTFAYIWFYRRRKLDPSSRHDRPLAWCSSGQPLSFSLALSPSLIRYSSGTMLQYAEISSVYARIEVGVVKIVLRISSRADRSGSSYLVVSFSFRGSASQFTLCSARRTHCVGELSRLVHTRSVLSPSLLSASAFLRCS